MIKLLWHILTMGFYDPMKKRMEEAEHEIDRLKVEAGKMRKLHGPGSPHAG